MESASLCFHPVAKAADISPDEPKRVVVGTQAIALYNLDDRYMRLTMCAATVSLRFRWA